MLPVRLLLERGDRTFNAVFRVLRCSKCRGRPAPVYLVAGFHRTFNHGPEPDWSVELVPVPSAQARQGQERRQAALRAIPGGLDQA